MKQITENYCSFETAKLLKEKGFDGECSRFYMPSGNGRWKYGHYHDFDISERIDCPTHQMAFKWLREVHKIFICIVFLEDIDMYGFTIEDTSSKKYLATSKNDGYAIYEKACEAAIKYCLEKLI